MNNNECRNDSIAECHNRRFAIAGVGGYIAPRHIKAIKSTGNELVAAYDVCDSVGILDSYFPAADFTTDSSSFVRRLNAGDVDFLSICTPNHMHCSHTLMGLDAGTDVICEKPVALSVGEIMSMSEAARVSGRNVWVILQLRLHPEIMRLKKLVAEGAPSRIYDVDLAYITPRGKWYAASWKGDVAKSGGVACNIGIHFIDMLLWIFGPMKSVVIHHSSAESVAGLILLDRARVRFFLSIDASHRPDADGQANMTPYRNLTIDGENFDFTGGFTDLHTLSYSRILEGNGFSVEDAAGAICVLEEMNRAVACGISGDCHPLAVRAFSCNSRK